jgi:spermidine synthase
MTDPETRNDIMMRSPGTFEINVLPPPEYAYISTNFLAGTPVYNLSKEGLAKGNSKIQLFSQSMEAPYILLDRPKVLVIGAGGGRDLFMAKTHGAVEILGAEINPGIVKEMSPGGSMYDYSGRVYTMENTKVHLIDGRHLVKNIKSHSLDFIVLNGVDTFSGLSSGAYAYAESYLYTKNALIDYLRVLKDNGIINFNRWLFRSMPRETLRLHAIALEALKDTGAENPGDHIIIGGSGWSFMLIKKIPFTDEERNKVFDYFTSHGIEPLYPNGIFAQQKGHPLNAFSYYAEDFKENLTAAWRKFYPYDISVITDDNPFFYKYYKLKDFNPLKSQAVHHTGTVIFLTQTIILLQAIVFIGLFIGLPLFIFKRKEIKNLPTKCVQPFIIYFSCLGCGFMFIEIPVMQRFVLLLGSPIYSIAVVLSVLLISAGTGSMALKSLQSLIKSSYTLLTVTTFCLLIYIITLVGFGTTIYDHFMAYVFPIRVLLVSSLLFPLGFCLGVFFPLGLQLVSNRYSNTIPWAWGINCGFSVLGSILSIILAQFIGFNAILLLASTIYLTALLSFNKMIQTLN